MKRNIFRLLYILAALNILLSALITIYIFDSFYNKNYNQIDSFYTYIAIAAFFNAVLCGNIRKILNTHLVKYNFASLSVIFGVSLIILLFSLILYNVFDQFILLIFNDIKLLSETIHFVLYLALFLYSQIFRSILEVSKKYELVELITIIGNLLYAWFLIKLPFPEINEIIKLLLFKTLFEILLLFIFSITSLITLRFGAHKRALEDYFRLSLGNFYYKSEGLYDRYLVQGNEGFISSLSLSGTVISAVQTFYMKVRVVPIITESSSDIKSEKSQIKKILQTESKVINLLVIMGLILFLGYVYIRNYDVSIPIIFLCSLIFFKYSLLGTLSSALLNCKLENKKQVIFGIVTFSIFIPLKLLASTYSEFLIPIFTGIYFYINYRYHVSILMSMDKKQ